MLEQISLQTAAKRKQTRHKTAEIPLVQCSREPCDDMGSKKQVLAAELPGEDTPNSFLTAVRYGILVISPTLPNRGSRLDFPII